MIDQSGVLKRIEESNAVYFSAGGYAGTLFPIGTPQYPVNNVADLLAIVAARGIRKVVCLSDITLNAAAENLNFISDRPRMLTMNLNGQSIAGSTIEGFKMRGNQGAGASKANFSHCDFVTANMTGLNADFWDCRFMGAWVFTHAAAVTCQYFNCAFGEYVTISANSGDIHIFKGKCFLYMYIEGPIADESYIDMDGSCVDLEDNLADPYTDIFLFGSFQLEDNSAGTRVLDFRDMAVAGEARPRLSFLEAWEDAAIDALVWSTTNPATGTAWACIAKNEVIVARTDPALSENARLRSIIRFPCPVVSAWRIFDRLVLEWEMQFESKTVLDNAACFFGLMSDVAGTRASQNIIGFGLSTDHYQAVSDKQGTEYVGAEVTDLNEQPNGRCLLRIELWHRNRIIWYINNFVVGYSILATQQPAVPMYINFYIATEAGGSDESWIGPIRCWAEDYMLGRGQI
jgi:hypothetical protein